MCVTVSVGMHVLYVSVTVSLRACVTVSVCIHAWACVCVCVYLCVSVCIHLYMVGLVRPVAIPFRPQSCAGVTASARSIVSAK